MARRRRIAVLSATLALMLVVVVYQALASTGPSAGSSRLVQSAESWPVLLQAFVVEGQVEAHEDAEDLFERIAAERPLYAACDRGDCPSAGVARWRAAVGELRARIARGESATSQAVLRDVSRLVNRWPHVSDDDEHRWLTPIEYFGGFGDCEDNAIAKYVTLRELGVPKERLFIVVSHAYLDREVAVHANLAVRGDTGVWFLENQLRPEGLLSDAEAATYLTPLYVVHEESAFGVLPLIGAPCRFPVEVTRRLGLSCDPELQILTRACEDQRCPGDARTACIDLGGRGPRCLRLQWRGYCGVGEPTVGRVTATDTLAVACNPG